MLMYIVSIGTIFATIVKVKDETYYLKGTENEEYKILETNDNVITLI